MIMANQKQAFGAWGEAVAVDYLTAKGYTILVRNYRALRGEIDIIARLEKVIIFVEVKTGRSRLFGPPEERITPSKQRQLYKIASHYIQFHPDDSAEYRFDAVIIDGTEAKYELRHYPNAFYLF